MSTNEMGCGWVLFVLGGLSYLAWVFSAWILSLVFPLVGLTFMQGYSVWLWGFVLWVVSSIIRFLFNDGSKK